MRQHDLEILRRSVAMQSSGQNALERDLALAIIDEVRTIWVAGRLGTTAREGFLGLVKGSTGAE